MGRSGARSLVLDSGALIAFERADRRVRAAIRRAAEASRILVPAGVVAEVWRDGTRQATLATLLKSDAVTVPALDEMVAKAAGALCGRSGTEDVVDASVVLAARAADAVVLTGDPADLSRIDPGLAVEALGSPLHRASNTAKVIRRREVVRRSAAHHTRAGVSSRKR